MKDRWKREKQHENKRFSSLGGSIRGQSSHQPVPETDKFKVRMQTQDMTTNSS